MVAKTTKKGSVTSGYNVISIEPQDRDLWDAFLSEHDPSNLLQSFGWGEFRQMLGHRVYRIALVDDEKILAAAQVYIETSFPGIRRAHLEYGPIVSPLVDKNIYPLFMQELSRFLKQQAGCTSLVIEPDNIDDPRCLELLLNTYIDLKYKPVPSLQPKRTLRVALSPSEDEILANCKQKTRYNIRLAQKKGVTIRFSPPFAKASEVERDKPDIDQFFSLLTTTAKRQNVTFYPKSYFQTMWDVFAHNQGAVLAFAEHNDTPLAALLLVFAGDTAFYLFGGTADHGRELMGNYLLHYRSICLAKEHGLRWYDFWGIANEGDPHFEHWKGITRFKKGFNGREIQYPQAYKAVFSKTAEHIHGLSRLPIKLLRSLKR